ncbi:MAG: ABC transporter substrate-binding protein [bacterium]|nr:ABC transporter substrate-binding protein [bacterium]
MKRRDFILGLGSAALCSNAARGQQASGAGQLSATKKRVAHVDPALKVEDMKVVAGPFFDELKRLGYVEGENLVVERYSGGGRIERYQSLAQEVVETKPDLILSIGAPLTGRFKAVTSTIPILAVTGDPIRFGIVTNIARPGGNITGVSVDAGVAIWGKRLEILAEAVPKLARVAYVSTRGNLNSAGGKATEEVAKKLGISLVPAPVDSPVTEAEYRRVFDSIQRDQIDGIFFSAEFEHQPHRRLAIQLVQQIRLPAVHIFPDDVEAGALMSYALDAKAAFRTMSAQAVEILKGANPGDMPYVQGVHYELAINLKTAKALGLELPATLLARADKVIE